MFRPGMPAAVQEPEGAGFAGVWRRRLGEIRRNSDFA
jgi:hypothetical protein